CLRFAGASRARCSRSRRAELGPPYTGSMLRHIGFSRSCRFVLASGILFGLFLSSSLARAWENDGHRMINWLAVATLPADTPAFLRTQAAAGEIEYLGPEPDRWR